MLNDMTDIPDDATNVESQIAREDDYAILIADLDEIVDKMMCDPSYYDEIVGWF